MKTRRRLLVALGTTALLPRAVLAQSKQPVLIGWLHEDSRELSGQYVGWFKEGLVELGWKERSHFVLEERWANGQRALLQSLAEELAVKRPAVIVAGPLQSVSVAVKAAPRIPIVQAGGSDPVAQGLVKSLALPGGMITGITNVVTQLSEKYLELLLAAAPKLRRVGFLGDSNALTRATQKESMQRSLARYPVEARFSDVANPEEIEPAISRLAKEGVQGLIVTGGPLLRNERRRIAKLALAQRWPVIAGGAVWAEAGALLSYGADASALYRRAAYYVDRILKGAKPGDLPIEQPTKFELVINMKTAKALGITIPQSVLLRADRVIE